MVALGLIETLGANVSLAETPTTHQLESCLPATEVQAARCMDARLRGPERRSLLTANYQALPDLSASIVAEIKQAWLPRSNVALARRLQGLGFAGAGEQALAIVQTYWLIQNGCSIDLVGRAKHAAELRRIDALVEEDRRAGLPSQEVQADGTVIITEPMTYALGVYKPRCR